MSRINRLMLEGARRQTVMAKTLWNAKKRVWKHIDETRPLVEPAKVERWAVLQVAPRMEAKAAEALRDAGYHAWYPQLVKATENRTLWVRRKFNEPLFVRYVFAAAGSVAEANRMSSAEDWAHKVEKGFSGRLSRSALGITQ